MIAFVYDWIQNIAFYLLMMIVVLHMIPNDTYKRYIRFFVGMILILMLAAPLLKLWNLESFPVREYETFLQEMEGVLEGGIKMEE